MHVTGIQALMLTLVSANTPDSFHSESFTLSTCAVASSSSCKPISYDLSALKKEEAIATVGHESLENNVIFKVWVSTH